MMIDDHSGCIDMGSWILEEVQLSLSLCVEPFRSLNAEICRACKPVSLSWICGQVSRPALCCNMPATQVEISRDSCSSTQPAESAWKLEACAVETVVGIP